MIQGTEDARYAFVNGIIRAREAKLLKKNHFERLINADPASFNAILADSAYSDHNLPESLNKVEREERSFFNKYCLHIEARRCLEWPEAIHNLKVNLKNGPKELLYPCSMDEIESWEDLKMVIGDYMKHKDNFLLGTSLDRVLCSKLRENAKFSEFFLKFYELYFDLENIRSFFRVRQFENPEQIFEQVFIEYGTIPKEKFLEVLHKDNEAVVRSFRSTPYEILIEQAIESFKDGVSFLTLEKLIEEKRLNFLKQARFYTFGVEPLFGYYHFKMAEVKSLRQIYIGKIHNIPASQIEKSIPDVW